MARGVEPLATWYYVFAWYPALLVADAAIARREGRWFLCGRPAFALTLFLWSVPFWLVFETLNLRLENWFYVYVPAGRAARWAGIVLSFATVLPAILTSERLLAAFGIGRGLATPRFEAKGRLRAALQIGGALALALSLAWPRVFFPLVWVGVTLLADPFVHRRDPRRSLLGDFERGRPGRIVRLLAGGLAIGLVWELFNAAARGKWIYTVPGFDSWKLFEMPLLGFLGFPVFALEGFAVWQALVVSGLAVPRERAARPAPAFARAGTALLAATFSGLALLAMDRATIASTTPRLVDLPGTPSVAALGRWDVFGVARARPVALARATGVSVADARRWIEAARLATLRGLGAENAHRLHALGIASIDQLGRAEPEELARRLVATGPPIPAARLRVWVAAAREASAPP
jgi:hypothetical protein